MNFQFEHFLRRFIKPRLLYLPPWHPFKKDALMPFAYEVDIFELKPMIPHNCTMAISKPK